jgi:hypothetical protein
MILPHVTLNTGHVAEVDLARVDAATIRQLGPLWPHGGKLPPPLGAYRVTFGGEKTAASVSIWRGKEPLVIFGVCLDPHRGPDLWTVIEKQYLTIAEILPQLGTEYPPMPDGNWIQVCLLPSLLAAAQSDIALMGRLEQAIAATLATL